jgi:hypothetical protein
MRLSSKSNKRVGGIHAKQSSSGNDLEEKKRLLLCDSATDASYTVSIPGWAIAPILDGEWEVHSLKRGAEPVGAR